MIQALFFLAAAAAGLLQVHSLRRTARATSLDPFGLPLRMLLVGAVLVGAAVAHCLPAAVSGWVIAFVLATLVAAWRWS